MGIGSEPVPISARPRWSTGLLALSYLVIGALWFLGAFEIAPRWLADAYHGQSWAPLNRILARTSRKPLEHYLGLWYALTIAVGLAIGAHAIVVAFLRHRRPARSIFWFLAITSAIFLAMTVLVGPRQDYPFYVEIWAHVRQGGDPWWVSPRWGYPLNAYGPLFVLLTPLAQVNPLAPKLLFATAYLLMAVAMAVRAWNEPELRGWPRVAMVAFLFNPWFWLEIGWYGHFDILIALACLGAVSACEDRREPTAGTALGLGFLLKFFPAVLGPVLTFAGRRVRWRFALSALLIMLLGMGGAWAFWGNSIWRPLAFASTRPSQFLSIFRFLRGNWSPLRLFTDHPNLDGLALPCLVLTEGMVCALAWAWAIDATTSSVLAALSALLFYRVGFPPYHTVLFVLTAYWCLVHPNVLRTGLRRRAALTTYSGWVVFVGLFDNAVGGIIRVGSPWVWFEDVVGLPTFLLGSWLVIELIRSSKPRASSHP